MRISIRFQILALMSAVLLAALGAHLFLASRLLTQDKITYLYDLESSLVSTASEELRAGLSSFADKLAYFAAEQSRGDPERAAAALVGSDADLLAVEIWRPARRGFERAFARMSSRRLAEIGLADADAAEALRTTPVPFEAVLAEGPLLQNASLPPDTALLSLAAPARDGRVVVGLLRPERALRVFARSPAYRFYLVDGRGRIVAHPDPARVVARESADDVPIVRQALRGPLSRGAQEFAGPQGPVLGAFARVGLGRLAVIAEVSKDHALRAARQLLWRSLLLGLGIVFLAVFASVFFARRLTAPLARLEEATRAVAGGEFGISVAVPTRNEIGALAEAFNRMGRELADREARLSEAHTQLVQSEKLAVVGEMSASVAHEVKNPLSGIVGYAQLGGEAASVEEARELFRMIERHAWRANETVLALLGFARYGQAALETLDANRVAEDALGLMRHYILTKRVSAEVALEPGLPAIRGNANQLQQVLVNLIMNAGQAMEGCPRRVLTLRTARDGDAVVFSIEDTGSGIAPEVVSKLFQPFFTTRPPGQGTGLGLSVSQRIVKRHGGEIRVDSEPGRGSTFSVRIPLAVAESRPPVAAAAGR